MIHLVVVHCSFIAIFMKQALKHCVVAIWILCIYFFVFNTFGGRRVRNGQRPMQRPLLWTFLRLLCWEILPTHDLLIWLRRNSLYYATGVRICFESIIRVHISLLQLETALQEQGSSTPSFKGMYNCGASCNVPSLRLTQNLLARLMLVEKFDRFQILRHSTALNRSVRFSNDSRNCLLCNCVGGG